MIKRLNILARSVSIFFLHFTPNFIFIQLVTWKNFNKRIKMDLICFYLSARMFKTIKSTQESSLPWDKQFRHLWIKNKEECQLRKLMTIAKHFFKISNWLIWLSSSVNNRIKRFLKTRMRLHIQITCHKTESLNWMKSLIICQWLFLETRTFPPLYT